jgi:hypothetical protein
MKRRDQKYYFLIICIVQGKYFITLGEFGFYLANPVVVKSTLSICRCGMKHHGATKRSVVYWQRSFPDSAYIAL